MITHPRVHKVLFGGDYNPEQWDARARKTDIALMKKAHIDLATLNVFAWARIQPAENEYRFDDLDTYIKELSDAGIDICLATSTATHPAWMAARHPDILRVDIEGRKRAFGARQNSCPNSPTYRLYAPLLAQKLAERYASHPAVLAWHVSNEYGGHCYCENCKRTFHRWLKNRYGNIEELNRAWNTAFWGHTYYDWDEIAVPSHLSEQWPERHTACQIQTIDYYRFQSQSLLECYLLEADAIRRVHPQARITTNMMAAYFEIDYHLFGDHVDFISWDNYPSPGAPYTETAFNHSLMRGCKPGMPFALMEQTPSVTNWQPYNALKRPGVMRLQSYQALAHGSDTVLFFQIRRSRGCCEQFHGAVIDHYPREDVRVFREVQALGNELMQLKDSFLGSLVPAQAALIFDWDSLWAVGFSAGPSVDLDYTKEVCKYYDAFAREHIPLEVISLQADFSPYKIIIAPALCMISSHTKEKIEAFVREGGTLITTCMSGITDEHNLVTTEGYPGALRSLCGLWVEETDALIAGKRNAVVIDEGALAGIYDAAVLCDIIRSEGAEVLARYAHEFYAGEPALCHNRFGSGEVWYVGFCGGGYSDPLLRRLAAVSAERAGIEPLIPASEDTEDIEATLRRSKDGRDFVFILNHSQAQRAFPLPFEGRDLLSGKYMQRDEELVLKAYEVVIIEKGPQAEA